MINLFNENKIDFLFQNEVLLLETPLFTTKNI